MCAQNETQFHTTSEYLHYIHFILCWNECDEWFNIFSMILNDIVSYLIISLLCTKTLSSIWIQPYEPNNALKLFDQIAKRYRRIKDGAFRKKTFENLRSILMTELENHQHDADYDKYIDIGYIQGSLTRTESLSFNRDRYFPIVISCFSFNICDTTIFFSYDYRFQKSHQYAERSTETECIKKNNPNDVIGILHNFDWPHMNAFHHISVLIYPNTD